MALTGVQGLELPPSRPTVAATHPQLSRQGQQLIADITNLTTENEAPSTANFADAVISIFDCTIDFVHAVLAARSPDDFVAY